MLFVLSAVGTFLWSTRKPKAGTDRTIIHVANDALKQANQSSLRTQKWKKQQVEGEEQKEEQEEEAERKAANLIQTMNVGTPWGHFYEGWDICPSSSTI